MTTYLPNILITGGRGQVGQALQHHSLATHFQLIASTHSEVDILNTDSILRAISHYHPDIIINAAAYTAVDLAEEQRDEALRINHVGAENLAIACHQHTIPLIHLSTNYIFDGHKNSPYDENDIVNPINHYGKSKWLGEQSVSTHCEKHIILRISSIFGEYGNNFLKTMLKLAEQKKEMRIIADQITSPTYTGDIAHAILTIANFLTHPTSHHYGTYHYCNLHPDSWYQFAVSIIEEAKRYQPLLVENIIPIESKDYPTAAIRPLNSALMCHKIGETFGIDASYWQTAVKEVVRNYYHHSRKA